MHTRIITALIDSHGPDITGRDVPMPAGSQHEVSEYDLGYFRDHPDVFLIGDAHQTKAEALANELASAMSGSGYSKSSEFKVSEYGADATGATDSSAAVQAAFTAAGNGGTVVFDSPDKSTPAIYAIANSIFSTHNVTVRGDMRVKIIPKSGGTFTAGAMFLINTTDGNNWTQPYPWVPSPKWERLIFDNSSEKIDVVPIICGSRAEFSDMRFTWFAGTLIKGTDNYLDFMKFQRIHITNKTGTDFCFILRNLGDGFVFSQVTIYDGNGIYRNLLSMNQCLSGTIVDCINGTLQFIRCAGVTVINSHIEWGQILINASSVTIRDSVLYENATPAVICTDVGYTKYIVNLENNAHVHLQGNPETRTPSPVQVVVGMYSQVNVKNCHKMYMLNGQLGQRETGGIQLGDTDTTPLADWARFAYQYSKRGSVQVGKYVAPEECFYVKSSSVAYNPVTAAISKQISSPVWGAAAATYYYTFARIYDPVRKIGKNTTGSEQTITMTSDDFSVLIQMGSSSHPNIGFFRIYRGTTSGSYDSYVDIPISASAFMYDHGTHVNSYAWKTRTAGAADTLYSIGSIGATFTSNTAELIGSAAPTVGTWSVGDRIKSSTYTSGTPSGWECSVAGTPGTWVALPNRP